MDTELVLKAIEYVEHTAINATLKELGILSKVEIVNNEVKAEFAFPFPNIPIKDTLIGSVQIIAESFGYKFSFTERLMTEEEKKHFLEVEHANWKGGAPAC
jgi:hypothetical protein